MLALLVPMPPVPLAMPPPPLPAVLSVTWLALRVSVPPWLRIPPALPDVVSPLTWLALRVVVPSGPVPRVPDAMPPPLLIGPPWAALPVTWLRFSVSVPSRLRMPPPMPVVFPPVIVKPCTVRFPVPPTSRTRKLLSFPAIVVAEPFRVIGLVMTGSPLLPSVGLVLLAAVSW